MCAREAASLLHDGLAAVARRHPGRPGVIEPDRTLTLEDLYGRSLSLAAAFVHHGLDPGDRVALLMEKSSDAIVAMYATLLAGGVCVPIQPGSPRPRVDLLIEQCGARLLISDETVAGSPAESTLLTDTRSGAPLDWARWLAMPASELPRHRSAADPALILFTSGSTGVPKGVTLSHAAVGAFVEWSAAQFGLSADDRLLCPSPLSFDLSTFDVFNIARTGSACVVAPRAAIWIPRLLLDLAREQQITAWYSVPSILTRLIETAGLAERPLASLRTILFAGEVMPPRTAARLQASHPSSALYNLYGPTETNVVTWHRLSEPVTETRPVPIGVPCPYARVRVARADDDDEAGAGLLLVGGASVMSGYWNRPEETARAFVTLEDGPERHRYYQTGDRVVENASRELLFLGRADRQVKRRGFRVELGEIEAALASHPALADAAVIAAAEGSLTAFVQHRSGEDLEEPALRAHCARFLPAYMIPDRFVRLAQMPRGSRGKIDYDTLLHIIRSSP